MKFKCFLIFSIISISLSNCKENNKPNIDPKLEFDNQKTLELLSQIFEDEKDSYFSTNCISEKAFVGMPLIVSGFRNKVTKNLKIEDSTHYNFQYQLFKEFKLTEDIISGKNIISQKKFKELENNESSFWEWLDENCSFGYTFISKPIFNESYDLAYVEIGHICGGLCGGGNERIYEFMNGKWVIKETFGNWVA